MSAAGATDGARRGLWQRYRRWSTHVVLRGLPEWRMFPSLEAREAAVQRMDADVDKSRSFGCGVLAVAAGATILANASFALVPILGRRLGLITGRTPLWVTIGVFIGIVACGVMVVLWLWRRGIASVIRRHLVDAGVPICIVCGYSLRGVSVENCPECGAPVDPRVRAIMAGAELAEPVEPGEPVR